MAKTPKKAGARAETAEQVPTKASGNGGKHAAKHAARRRRTSPTLLAGLGVVVVGGLGFLVVGRGGLQRATPPAGPAPVTSPSVGGELITPEDATPSPSAPPVFELSEARDPFKPLVVPPPEGAAGTTAPGASPAPSAGSGAGGAPAPEGGEQVELLDVVVDDQGTTKAQVKVGSTVSTVSAGETFASTYELLSIQGTCATLQNGTDKFTLCKGDLALK